MTIRFLSILLVMCFLPGVQGQRPEAFKIVGYAPLESAEGAILLTTAIPDLAVQRPNVYLIGSDGLYQTYEVDDEALLSDLRPGVYSLAVTDDELRLVEGKVEVRAGEVVNVDVILYNFPGNLYNVEDFELFGLEFDENVRTEPANQMVILSEVSTALSVTGPDGFHRFFDETTGVELDELDDGTYSVAATAPGHALVETKVLVANGQNKIVQLELEPFTAQ